MSLRGTVTLECDQPGCHAELVLNADDANIIVLKRGLNVEFYADGWRLDDDVQLWCPQCAKPEERDEAYERAAARDRADGFARTGGKDWT